MPETLRTEQWTPYPVELVFAFFANPGNLPHLMPRWQQAKVESSRFIAPPPRPVAQDPTLRFQSPAAGVGSEMAISFRPIPRLPLRIGWLARITEFVWNSHFCDEQIRGPFTHFRHRHGIRAEIRESVEGTKVSDEIEFALPYAFIGRIGGTLVRRNLVRSFTYRQKRLPEVLAAAARQAIKRA
jgi:ligand-binding SRPBCC domain-containing protein